MNLKRGEELATDHWHYIKEILIHAGKEKQSIEEIGYHYITSFIHGYKHAIEDLKNEQ